MQRGVCGLCALLLFAFGGLFTTNIAASYVRMGAYFTILGLAIWGAGWKPWSRSTAAGDDGESQ
jgi:accessory gene regulator protein AgrB